jgi:hypothetical protein
MDFLWNNRGYIATMLIIATVMIVGFILFFLLVSTAGWTFTIILYAAMAFTSYLTGGRY